MTILQSRSKAATLKTKTKTIYNQGIMSQNDLDPVREAFRKFNVWIQWLGGLERVPNMAPAHRRSTDSSQSLRRYKYKEQRGQEMTCETGGVDGRHPRSTCLSALWLHVWWCGHTAAPQGRGWTQPAQSRIRCSSWKVKSWLAQRGPRNLQLVPPRKSQTITHNKEVTLCP